MTATTRQAVPTAISLRPGRRRRTTRSTTRSIARMTTPSANSALASPFMPRLPGRSWSAAPADRAGPPRPVRRCAPARRPDRGEQLLVVLERGAGGRAAPHVELAELQQRGTLRAQLRRKVGRDEPPFVHLALARRH